MGPGLSTLFPYQFLKLAHAVNYSFCTSLWGRSVQMGWLKAIIGFDLFVLLAGIVLWSGLLGAANAVKKGRVG